MMHRSLPDAEPRIYGPQRIAAVVDILAQDGVDPAQVLAGSDLDEATLVVSSTRVSYTQVRTVFRNALHLSPDPAFALRAGARMHVTQYGIWGYALLSSSSFAKVLEFSIKHRRVVGPISGMIHDRASIPTVCAFEVLLSPDPNDPLYRLALEFTYAAHLTLSRDVFGPDFTFAAVRVTYPAPRHASAYQTLLKCPVQFDQPANELRFESAWKEAAPNLHDGVIHEMARESCQQTLDELAQSGGRVGSVRCALVSACLGGSRTSRRWRWSGPSSQDIASEA
jgi:hypothetical protein